ncbi:MAG: sensor histidine kinase [Porcipelethomonas sp.]
MKSNHIWFIVLVSLGTIVIGVITIETVTVKNMIIAVVLMMINFLNFYMYDRDLKNLQVQHTFKLIETSNHAYQNQLKIMNESQKKIRLLKHDMKNHMYKMQKLIMNGEYQEAENYIEEMTGAMSVNNEYVNTGNNDVDCLLNYKLSIAKEMNVEFSCDISLPEKLSVSSFDMTTILGNLLDNSLNALKKTDDKQLNISIKYSKGTIQINIENTYRSEKKQDNDKNQGHGLGLLSIRQTLEKYHGILNITHTENIYCVNIFMYNGLE